MRLLVIDDDPVSRSLLEAVLEQDGMIVTSTGLGEDALELVRDYDFDAITLDLGLPDLSGRQVLRRLRAMGVTAPVIIVSATDSRDEKIGALFDGADDYLLKPFDKVELLARLKTVVRRAKGHAASEIRIGRMCVDLATRGVTVDGVALPVTGKEYSILELLALRKGMTLSKETFLDHLYGGRDEPEQKIIDVFVCKLRKKIAAVANDDHNIETVWGQGYVLRDPAGSPGLAEAAAEFLGVVPDPAELSRLRLQELEALLLGLLPGAEVESGI